MVNFEHALFGCVKDVFSCLIICLVPGGYCIYEGLTVAKATGESCLVAYCCPFLLCCIGAAVNRGKIRDKYIIGGSFCEDCMLHCFCGACAACQEYREVNDRERMNN